MQSEPKREKISTATKMKSLSLKIMMRPARWVFIFIIPLILAAPPLYPWKTATHAHLAFIARADAIDDGMVTIYEVNYETGRFVRDAAGYLKEIGRYPVDPAILAALRNSPFHFKAGTVGADFFPELIAAQTGVHPNNDKFGGTLSTEWVRPLYESARRKYSDRAIAFAAGFLTHCAGDIYGHPFVNNYAGGPFMLGENALKHIVLESYIDNRTPKNDPNFYQISIDGIERWIYDNLIATSLVWDDAQPENLTNYEYRFNFSPVRLYRALRRSVSWMRTTMTDYLKKEKQEYNNRIKALRDEGVRLAASNPVRSRQLLAEAAALKVKWEAIEAAAVLFIKYLDAWIDDIDDGLKAWPQFARRLGEVLFFCPDADLQTAQGVIQDFANAHLYSMSGAPDVAGDIAAFKKKVWDSLPEIIRTSIDFLTTDFELYLLQKAWGITWDILKNPQVHFDFVMNQSGPDNKGEKTTLKDFNRNVLKISDTGYFTNETYDWMNIPAMVNSVTLMKLSFLGEDGLRMFVTDLDNRGFTSNVYPSLLQVGPSDSPPVLGYLHSLDENDQWCLPPKLIFVRDPCVYRKLFMKQTGESLPSCAGICDLPEDGQVTSVQYDNPLAPSSRQFLAVKSDGSAWQWGYIFNVPGAAYAPFKPPVSVAGLPKIASCAIEFHNRYIALAEDGTVWTWGDYDVSILNPGMNPWIPARMPNLESITMVAAGVWHYMALRSNGTVWTWGANSSGEIGWGRRESTSVPRRVPGLNYIKFIAAGDSFCLAVKTDGTLWAWGGNYEGQLGDGTKVDRYSPVQVPNLTNVTAAAGGYGHSLALKADGTVWAWGKNFNGQVGDGTKDTRLSPVKIQHLIKVVAVAAGDTHSVALKDDGTVWGSGYFNQQGRGQKTDPALRPIKITGLPPIKAIAANNNYTMALDTKGFIWVWGADDYKVPTKIESLNLRR